MCDIYVVQVLDAFEDLPHEPHYVGFAREFVVGVQQRLQFTSASPEKVRFASITGPSALALSKW